MESKPKKARLGVTLIEVMVGLTVIVVGILGAAMYRYQAALQARTADIQVGAGRVALLVLEGWKGAAGSDAYNPSNSIPLNGYLANGSDDIEISGAGPYTVKLLGGTNTNYTVTLTRVDGATNDITGDGVNDPGLVKLNVEAVSGLHTVMLSDFVRN